MRELYYRPQDEDYAAGYEYDWGADAGASTIRTLHVDAYGGVWLESTDGQRVLVPSEIRGLIAKRIREAKFR